MERLATFVLQHRLLVVLFWAVAMLSGGATAGQTTERLAFDFSLPGQQGYETERRLLERYGNGPDQGTTLVAVTVPSGRSVEQEQSSVDRVYAEIRTRFPQYRVLWSGNADSGGFTTDDGRTAYGVVVHDRMAGPAAEPVWETIDGLLDAQQSETGFDIATTGYRQLSAGSTTEEEGSEPTGVLGETLLGAAGALVILAFVFASLLAFVPLVVAMVSILSTFLCVLAVTYVTDVNVIVQLLIALIGLGVAIDYSLLVVVRWREERQFGRENHAAVVESVRTAGRAVVASACTVAISLLALVIVPVPFLRSMGIGGMLIPLISTAVVLTLLPVVLSSVGPRVDWPRLRRETSASGAWTAWAGFVYRRRWIAAGAGFLVIGSLIAPVLDIKIGQARSEALASQGPAFETLAGLKDGGVPAGVVTPLEVLLTGPDAGVNAELAARRVGVVDGIALAVAPDDPTWRLRDSAVVHVIPEQELVDTGAAEVVDDVLSAVSDVPGVAGVAGPGATVVDYSEAVFQRLPLVVGLIAIATFLLLVRAFRSVLLPLKAVLLNFASVGATFGFVVLFWQLGYGSETVFGVAETGAVTFWLPVLIFAFLFGLSMDYEVFILARMREEYDRSGSTRIAVVQGLGRTGRLVTCAALILFWAFIALASAPGTEIKVLATALGVGVLIDATVVRALLVPALVSLLGEWNWWLPGWLAALLRIKPSSHPAQGRSGAPLPGQRSHPRGPDAVPVPGPESPDRHSGQATSTREARGVRG